MSSSKASTSTAATMQQQHEARLAERAAAAVHSSNGPTKEAKGAKPKGAKTKTNKVKSEAASRNGRKSRKEQQIAELAALEQAVQEFVRLSSSQLSALAPLTSAFDSGTETSRGQRAQLCRLAALTSDSGRLASGVLHAPDRHPSSCFAACAQRARRARCGADGIRQDARVPRAYPRGLAQEEVGPA